jgi:hypothetical protein
VKIVGKNQKLLDLEPDVTGNVVQDEEAETMSEESKKVVLAESYGLSGDVSGAVAYSKITSRTAGADFLRVNGKTGAVAFGVDNTPLPAGAKLAGLIGMLEYGYVLWEDGSPVDQAWLSIAAVNKDAMRELRESCGNTDSEDWEERDARGKPKDPYRESVRAPFLWLQERKPLLFTASSDAGCNAVKNLLTQSAKQSQPDCLPICEIEVNFYQHPVRTIGQVFYPVFRIGDWMPVAQVLSIQNGQTTFGEAAPRRAVAAQKPTKSKKR